MGDIGLVGAKLVGSHFRDVTSPSLAGWKGITVNNIISICSLVGSRSRVYASVTAGRRVCRFL